MENKIITTISLLAIGALFLSGSAMAAGSPQSRLITMETYGADANYVQPSQMSVNPSAPSQTTGVPVPLASLGTFLGVLFQMAIGASMLILLYFGLVAIVAHYRKPHIKMHSHAAHSMMLRRHR